MSELAPSGQGLIKNRWVAYCVLAVFCLASLPFLSNSFFPFLVTPQKQLSSHGIIIAVALLITVLVFVVILLRSDEVEASRLLKRSATIAAIPVFLTFVFYLAIFGSIPLLYTAVIGKEAEMRVTVEDPEAENIKGCRHRIELRDMPFFFNNLCDVSDDIRNSLKPGDILIVSGRGSRFGIFVRSVAVAE